MGGAGGAMAGAPKMVPFGRQNTYGGPVKTGPLHVNPPSSPPPSQVRKIGYHPPTPLTGPMGYAAPDELFKGFAPVGIQTPTYTPQEYPSTPAGKGGKRKTRKSKKSKKSRKARKSRVFKGRK